MSRFFSSAALCILLVAGAFVAAAFAKKEFVHPPVQPAATYPAKDSHPTEKVAVAIDPYDTPEKASIFTVHYAGEGFLPVRLIISNDGNEPISLKDLKVELVTGRRSKIAAADNDDLYRRLSKPQRNDQPKSPLPFPRSGKVKGAVGKDAMNEIQTASFAAQAAEPKTTRAGFVFFDVQDVSHPMEGATVYVSGIRDNEGKELMFFEIPLDKYLNAPSDPLAPK
jgi:hypothetical protein